MKKVNNSSGLTGVTFEIDNGKNKYWVCRVQRKNLRFKKRFPFTEAGKNKAAETYKEKVNALYTT